MRLHIIYDPPELQEFLQNNLNQNPYRYITNTITLTLEYLNQTLPRSLIVKVIPNEPSTALKGLHIPTLPGRPNILLVRADEDFTLNLVHETIHELTDIGEENTEHLAREIVKTIIPSHQNDQTI